ncbi:hypothetical protein L1987_20466 [Smallanthus sonchifolius]|uniref:Uncharacterized protein n=1 Tax=Smallanthus sonchifolius TaxID=185202 RepID=A0ACB9ITL6_9ASTR|nr:hypothetical protein L1987_20466 [Smallanthus sonchifolius]
MLFTSWADCFTGTAVKPVVVKNTFVGKKDVVGDKEIAGKKEVVGDKEIAGKKEVVGKKETAGKPKKASSVKGKGKEETPEPQLLVEDNDSITCSGPSPFVAIPFIILLPLPIEHFSSSCLIMSFFLTVFIVLEIVKAQCALDKEKLVELVAVIKGERQKVWRDREALSVEKKLMKRRLLLLPLR